MLWKPLGVSTLWLVRFILKLFSEDVVYQPAERIIGTTAFDVEIAPACSGYEGMGLMLVLIGAFLLISRRTLRLPRALWLLPLGCLLAYLANAVRIAALILLGTHVSEEIALGGFHSRAGVLLFLAVGFGLIGLSLRSPLFSAADRQGEADVDSTASEAYLCPLMALVGITLVTGAFSSGYDPLYPLGLIVTCGLLWRYRKYYDDLCWTFAPRAVAIGVTVFALWIALEPWKSGQTPPTAPVPLAGAGAVAWVIARALGSVIVTPLVEELAFRGYLTRRLDGRRFQVGTAGHLLVALVPGLIVALRDTPRPLDRRNHSWHVLRARPVRPAQALGRRAGSRNHKCPDRRPMSWRRGSGHCGPEVLQCFKQAAQRGRSDHPGSAVARRPFAVT